MEGRGTCRAELIVFLLTLRTWRGRGGGGRDTGAEGLFTFTFSAITSRALRKQYTRQMCANDTLRVYRGRS